MGIEFVKNKATKAPFDFSEKIADRIGAESLRRGLIVYPGSGSVDGTLGDHILLAPPLIISRSEIDQIALILEESIHHIAHQVVP